jgi:hypothetical protein
LFDINSQGSAHPLHDSPFHLPHHALDAFAGIPAHMPNPDSAQPRLPTPRTVLQQVTQFFRPRNIVGESSPTPHANEVFGDTMQIPLQSHTTRLYFANLNGINLEKNAAKFRDLCEEIRMSDIQLFAGAEHNLDTNKFAVRQSLQNIARQSFTHHSLQTATSSTKADRFYKPGGTLILAQGDMVGRIKDRGSDSLGRWTWMKLVGRNNKIITIISAYQVCVRPTNRTGTTAYHQQESLLRLKGAKKANPRKYFHRDLNEFIRITKTRKEQIILVGDFNEPMSEKSSMARIASTHSLVDILFQRNSHLPEPNTYARGSTRIDYALISPELVDAVKACGYEPFHKRVKSDHRGMFLDFDTALLFGNDTQKMSAMAHRDFTAKNPSNNTTYIESKFAHLTEQRFFYYLAELRDKPHGDHEQAEKLDQMLQDASEVASKKVKRFYKPWWSLTITKARAIVEILRRQLSGYKTRTDVREALLERILDLSLDLILPLTKQACIVLYKEKQQLLSKLEQTSLETRHEELEAKANLAASSGDMPSKINLDKMRSSEAHAAMYRKIKAIRGKYHSGGFTSIEVPVSWPEPHTEHTSNALPDPKKATEWKTVDLPEEIVYYLLTRNRLHFGQAQGTPCTTPSFTRSINWQASTDTSELILHGDFNDDELSDLQALLYQHCQSPHLDALSQYITEEEYISKFKSWKEGTSTSPSGLHLGHYKALVMRNDSDASTDEGKETEKQRLALIRAQVSMINYSLKHSYSYTRWKNVVNVMIEKEAGNSKVHRLRVIHIYEADYNFLLQAKWREMIQKAESDKTLHPGQYGGRAGRDALIPAFIEELKNEICYASRKSLINFDNDAASCYDRIIPALASLIGRKYGLHRNVVFVHATTLAETKYKLKTSLGISTEFYENCQAFPIYGTGQGSGNSPAIWCIISSTLFSCHQDQAYGAYFCSPDEKMSVSLSMIGFVDDSTGQVNSFRDTHQPTPEFLREIMRHDAQLWSDLLWVSGGLLELSKCSFHQVHFDFLPDGTPMMRAGIYGDPLLVHDALLDTKVTIPAKSVHSPHKTLGHHKAPAGANSTQRIVLHRNSDIYAKLVATSPLDRTDSWFFYTAIYLTSMGYVLPNCFFPETVLKKLQNSALRAFLAKCGYNRNTHRCIVFAPIRYGGGGFISLYLLQGEGQILTFLKHWRTDTDAGNLLRIALSWAQLHVGTSVCFLTDTTTPLPHLPGRWLRSLRQFLARIDGSIELDHYFLPPIQRDRDVYIMDMILQSASFTPKEILRLNYCRLYLQAVTVSDLCMADGITMDPTMLSGRPGPDSSTSSWVHITQARPNEASWRLWRKACALWSLNNSLYHPLGAWKPGSQLRRQWPCYYDDSDGAIYLRQPSGYLRCIPTDPIRFIPESTLDWNPTDTSIPVQARLTIAGDAWIPLIPSIQASRRPHIPATFTDFLDTLEFWETELFANLIMEVDCYTFLALVNAQPETAIQLLTMSDGSDAAGAMTFGWILSLPNGQRLARCSGPAYGPYGSSFRAEGYGFLSVSRFLVRIQEFCHEKPQWRIQMMTDNQGLLTRVETSLPFVDPFPNYTLQADWDVTNEIITSIRQLSNTPTFVHVKGHQDDGAEYETLPLNAQLNVDADEEAGIYQYTFPLQRPIVPRLPSNRAQLHIAGKVIPSKLKKRIREAFTVPPYLAYLQERFKWSDQCVNTVNWTAYTQAIGRYRTRRIQITKLCNDLLPTARWVHRYDKLTTDHCLHCGETEDRDHIIRCTFATRRLWRNDLLVHLRATHSSNECDPRLLDILIDGLHTWFSHSTVDSSRYPRSYHKLIREQTEIGWRHLFNGHLTTQWRVKQDRYIRRMKIKTRTNTGAGWALRTMTTLWRDFFVLWKARNESIHGHDKTSQQEARKRKLKLEIGFLHDQRDQVLACDSDLFIADTPAALHTYLEVTSASQTQTWLNIWKPVILSSIASAKDLSLRGVDTITTYFPSTPNTAPRHPNQRTHRKARPKQRDLRPLPTPNFRFRSLRSFFGPHLPTGPAS